MTANGRQHTALPVSRQDNTGGESTDVCAFSSSASTKHDLWTEIGEAEQAGKQMNRHRDQSPRIPATRLPDLLSFLLLLCIRVAPFSPSFIPHSPSISTLR